jgi:hypothetical protein
MKENTQINMQRVGVGLKNIQQVKSDHLRGANRRDGRESGKYGNPAWVRVRFELCTASARGWEEKQVWQA